MIDLRPIFYVVGRILIVLAILMLAPAFIDWREGLHNGADFLQSAIITGAFGLLLSVATANALGQGLNARQAYLMTAAIWGFVPLFGALPFMLGEPYLSFTDAYFESVSGITTTGASMMTGLKDLPPGMNLWRGMLNSLGGLGIVFIAMIFLPVLRVGGMQYFRTEGFDTFGKVLPRATDIARQLLIVYFGLTLITIITYRALGMDALSAAVNGMATVSTGGFSNDDSSFTRFSAPIQYMGALFMFMSSLPYIRFVQALAGQTRPLWQDSQTRAYFRWVAYAVLSVTAWRYAMGDIGLEVAFRESLFNLISVQSSTGFGAGSFGGWGGFALIVAFLVGILGACSGSSASGLGVFRVQIAASALAAQIRQVALPSRVVVVRYEGRAVADDIISGLIFFITGWVLLFGIMTIAMTLTGVDPISALWGVWTTLANVGYGFGPLVAEHGSMMGYPTAAKWIMILAMTMGRLGLLAVLVLFLPRFWRD